MFDAYVEATQQTSTVHELETAFGSALAKEGYENYVFASVGSRAVKTLKWHKFPPGYVDAYLAEKWELVDPVLAASTKARYGFCWDDVTTHNELDVSQRIFLEECRGLGVHSGMVFPIHGPGHECDIISVSRRHSNPLPPNRAPFLQAICSQTWARYLELTGGAAIAPPEKDPKLTPREFEVLAWLKDGKRNTEIAEIMSISLRTVEYHIANLLIKLRASNRIMAVVLALQRGVLTI